MMCSAKDMMEMAGSKVLCLFLSGCLLGLLYNPEDGGSAFFKNFGKLLQGYSVTLQKMVLFIVPAGRISDLLSRGPLSVELGPDLVPLWTHRRPIILISAFHSPELVNLK
jgi:hypothetical protein